ncbi:MAG TPA: NAD-dependent epimerase/dehydratase family protein [Candidatus Limnocylindria bacterium]|nr:NAD-dependent epimerase/dehydratase family protein [Candidatus Limnocylindria bacterium]
MRVYVTGASGFVGGHVARILRERGADVRDERVDLLDGPRLERALAGCDALVHVAALYSYRASPRSLARVNIEGTRSVLAAAARAGVARIVHTSTAGTCGPVPDRPATEEDCAPSWELTVPYKSTKLEAERIALAAGAVVVNPTTPVGEGDRRPTPTGAMVRGVARGRLRGFVATTGLNIVDVRDVALGHALALERGTPGERYLLGGRDLWLEDLFAQIAAIAERPRPRIRVPYTVARAAGMLGLVNRHEVRLARLPMFFSSAKAERELGYEPSPVEPALRAAVREALAGTSRELGVLRDELERPAPGV